MKFSQAPRTVLMVRPFLFGINLQNAETSDILVGDNGDELAIHDSVLREFDEMVEKLRAHDIEVIVVNDSGNDNPDAIFPNNWISTHDDGQIILYPVLASDRRGERRPEIIALLKENFSVSEVYDLSPYEHEGKFLEGTGSLVFDHGAKIIFASPSTRTDASIAQMVADKLNYKTVFFHAVDERGRAVYHTNIVMAIGRQFAIICLDAISRDEEQEAIIDALNASGKKIIAISFDQMRSFAGNILEVETHYKQPVVLMSETAYNAFLPGQIKAIEAFSEILIMRVNAIEKFGGGSVRCMIAGIHLPVRK